MRRRSWLASVLVVVSGFAATDARAHGTITPSSARHGAKQQFSIFVPNASVNVPVIGFRLTPPPGVEAEALDSNQGWSTTVEGRTIVWSGSSIPAGGQGVFEFEADLPETGQAVTFQGEESYPTVPRSGLFPLTVEMTGSASASTSESRALPITVIVLGALTLAAVAAVAASRRRR